MPKYYAGYIDDSGSGNKNHLVELEWSTPLGSDSYFSVSGCVWNPRLTDITRGGQCVDDIAKMFPEDRYVQRIANVWSEYHLKRWENIPETIQKEISHWRYHREEPENKFAKWLDRNFQLTGTYIEQVDKHTDMYMLVIKTKPGYLSDGKCRPLKILTTEWRQGIGHRKDMKGRPYAPGYKLRGPQIYRGQSYEWSKSGSLAPFTDIFDSLLRTARDAEEYPDVFEFIDSFGYLNDKKSIAEGRRVHAALLDMAHKMEELLGYSLLQQFIRDENFIPEV